jgi:hypothetical protein
MICRLQIFNTLGRSSPLWNGRARTIRSSARQGFVRSYRSCITLAHERGGYRPGGEPDDAMNLNLAFDRLPDGTNHVASTSIEGIRKHLTINTTNSDYRRI